VFSKGVITPKNKKIYTKIQKSSVIVSGMSKNKKFDFKIIQGINFSACIQIDSMSINNRFELSDILLSSKSVGNRLITSGSLKFCDMPMFIESVISLPDHLASQIKLRGIDLDLTSFISCFSKELPIFLKGRLYLTGDFLTQGQDPISVINNSEGEFIATIDELFVYRLSNIDPRLSFFLDILRISGVDLPQSDSLNFNKCLVKVVLNKGRLNLERFFLRGSVLNAWGEGSFLINKKRLKLFGFVKTKFGIKKRFKIDKILLSEET
jgi:hypothetical protein